MSDFKLVTMTETSVVVRHDGEGHEFSFRIVPARENHGCSVMPDGQVRGLGAHDARPFLADATTFAEEQVDAAFQR